VLFSDSALLEVWTLRVSVAVGVDCSQDGVFGE
jgi:hypothetical protein